MKVLKIIVDELPKCCDCGCEFSATSFEDEPICVAKPIADYPIINLELNTRPIWCPLVVEEVCEWHEDIELPEHYKVSCSPYGWMAVGEIKFPYCQLCGKRIKYIESE